jgi:eukaryotic-like serine/threonine-protein kinase
MSLIQGARLGPYTIGSLLGAGGMGEVYRARDGKLDRDVAIKVLRADVVGDRERLARFEREARVLAALNHPNIANVIGLEGAGGTPALVMELVDGPTLALRIDEGPLPAEEAFEIARQIAEALEAAHDRGIIHRDLKPANIKVRPDGLVKVLDFGLAKALDPFDPQGVSDQANSPTITSPAMTMGGVILGTAAYMSPEQAKGRPVDRRADLWACGCVLYEMLTGRRAFEGEDTTETIAAVVTREPDWTALPPSTPTSIRRLLQRLLVKNPRQRIDSAAVVRLELAEATSALKSSTTERNPSTGVEGRRRWLPLGAMALLAAIGASLATWAAMPKPATVSAPVMRFELPLPAAEPLAVSFNARDISLSPAGTHLAYTAGLRSQLMVRALDALDAAPLEGITGARSPFFSPDGRWIGYFDQGGEMRRVAVGGGRPITIAKVDGTSRGAAWGADDVIVFATSNSRGLLAVPASGGAATVVAAVGPGERGYLHPALLPDRLGLLFTVVPEGSATPHVSLRDRSGLTQVLLPDASQAEYVPGGYLAYAANRSYWAVPFSLATLRTTGTPARVLEEVMEVGTLAVNVATSAGGMVAAVRPPRAQLRTIAWMSRDGSERHVPMPTRSYEHPRLSPSGDRLAVVVREDENSDIYTWDLRQGATQSLQRFTFEPLQDTYPAWAGDRQLIYNSMRKGVQNIYRRDVEGGSEEQLTQAATNQRPLAVSKSHLVYEENTTDNAWNLMRLPLDGTSAVQPLLTSRFDERNADVSPDGRWMAYESNESGQTEIYVRRFPRADGEVYQVSPNGGRSPAWSPAGGELFFVNGATMYAVATPMASTFRHASPVRLFDAPTALFDARQLLGGGAHRMYDVAKNGQEFVVVKSAGGGDQARTRHSIVIVQNWFDNAAFPAR